MKNKPDAAGKWIVRRANDIEPMRLEVIVTHGADRRIDEFEAKVSPLGTRFDFVKTFLALGWNRWEMA